jgi:hypothetical protein
MLVWNCRLGGMGSWDWGFFWGFFLKLEIRIKLKNWKMKLVSFHSRSQRENLIPRLLKTEAVNFITYFHIFVSYQRNRFGNVMLLNRTLLLTPCWHFGGYCLSKMSFENAVLSRVGKKCFIDRTGIPNSMYEWRFNKKVGEFHR